jgi:polysaccharide deacetylase family protein (PEP-CTERM system associated)
MPARSQAPIVNAMTVDVEDYFQVSAFDAAISREQWNGLESRVRANTDRLLAILDDAHVRGTFFVLGWVGERFPDLVRNIALQGHEVASHSYGHRLVYTLTPAQFREDLRRAKGVLEAASGRPVYGFRAPSYSITAQSLWALDILIDEGYLYDASIFPIHHDRYGMPSAPRHPHAVHRDAGWLLEVPASTVRWGTLNLPIAGGGYFRQLPYAWTRWGISHVNRVERRPAFFYLHPWEIDPEQPRLDAPFVSRLRHYRNLQKTETRLRRLLSDFRFAPIEQVLEVLLPGAAQGASGQPAQAAPRAEMSRMAAALPPSS